MRVIKQLRFVCEECHVSYELDNCHTLHNGLETEKLCQDCMRDLLFSFLTDNGSVHVTEIDSDRKIYEVV